MYKPSILIHFGVSPHFRKPPDLQIDTGSRKGHRSFLGSLRSNKSSPGCTGGEPSQVLGFSTPDFKNANDGGIHGNVCFLLWDSSSKFFWFFLKGLHHVFLGLVDCLVCVLRTKNIPEVFRQFPSSPQKGKLPAFDCQIGPRISTFCQVSLKKNSLGWVLGIAGFPWDDLPQVRWMVHGKSQSSKWMIFFWGVALWRNVCWEYHVNSCWILELWWE